VSYGPTLELQRDRHREVIEDTSDDTLFLLEHFPVVTTGRNTGEGHVLFSGEELARRGVELFETGRGGDVTYHAPGQIVGYPILKLQESEKDVRRFVWKLEEVLIRTAAEYGVAAERVEGLRGIWVGNEKLAAIGVRLSRWTTMHGFAMNISTDLKGFELIVPCGLRGRGVTSLQRLCGKTLDSDEVQRRLVEHTAALFERDWYDNSTL
jgi:lipoyl(octanoyl) transferase